MFYCQNKDACHKGNRLFCYLIRAEYGELQFGMAIGNINISACHCHATPNAAISSINYTLEIIEEMGSESKLYSKVVGFRVLHIGMCVKNFLTSKEFVPSSSSYYIGQ